MKTTAEHNTHTVTRAQSPDAESPFFFPKQAENGDAMATAEPFFQPKLKVGAPNDKYEQEADAVADQVVQRMAEDKARPQVQGEVLKSNEPAVQRAVVAPTIAPLPISRIQRSAEPEMEEQTEPEGEEFALQRKPIFDSDGEGTVQRKCDACSTNEEEGHIHRFPAAEIPEGVQRKCAACEAEEKVQPKAMPDLQRSGDGGFTASSDFSSRLASSRGGGAPLPFQTRTSMEDGIGADFSGVRIHTGSGAADLNRSIGAQAFTHGSDVYFNEGKYDPGTESGDRLLAHELTHTVQQGGAGVKRREFAPVEDLGEITLGDWASADRKGKTQVWKDANAFNLENGDNRQYNQIDQRRDFYLWFYEAMHARGHEIRWPLAAYIVAGGANEGANRDFAGLNFIRSNNLEALLRRGNQVIFDDVFPKLRRLYLQANILTGAEALGWDMRILIQEQNLIQPIYEELSQDELNTMAGIARQKGFLLTIGSAFFGSAGGGEYHEGGSVPSFPDGYELTNPEHRFRYGMLLAHYFSSETRDVATSKAWAEGQVVPGIPEDYQNGEALRKVDRFDPVHALAAEISDIVMDLDAVRRAIHQLNDEQRRMVAEDPWFMASLRHRHGMSPIAAIALLNSMDINDCGPLYQVVGPVESVGNITEADQVIVWDEHLDGWSPSGGGERVQVQAVSEKAYELFTGVPLRWVWKDSLRCYPPNREPVPIPDPIERSFQLFFDTGNATVSGDSHEFDNRVELNGVLSVFSEYGANPRVGNLNLYINGHASPRWSAARTGEAAAVENASLARERAGNVEAYLVNGYNEFQGPIPLAILEPESQFQVVPDNPIPADEIITRGEGSTEGLEETADPKNDDQAYRRVDIRITITFQH